MSRASDSIEFSFNYNFLVFFIIFEFGSFSFSSFN